MTDPTFVPRSEFDRVRSCKLGAFPRLSILADMCRINTLAAVKRAGSGHLGSSLSAMDLVTWLYFQEMNTTAVGMDSPDRDIYFSSKGHDAPGLYSVLYALGVIPEEKLLRLRRLEGLDGHPDVGIPGVEANSGSLGMGLSKAAGMAWAKAKAGRGGRVFVMLGDGEMQEGQNYEAMQACAHQHLGNVTAILDHNKAQSDKLVADIVDLGDMVAKYRSFGWHVAKCDGHDFEKLTQVFREFQEIVDQPKILIADTIKGKGVSFMEHPVAMQSPDGLYPWHSGAPGDESFVKAYTEIVERVNAQLQSNDLESLTHFQPAAPEQRIKESLTVQNALGEPVSLALANRTPTRVSAEYVAEAYGQCLLRLAETHPEIVVLDADLSADCRIRSFENRFPDRFVECGIAEQHMVSMAGGLARQGFLPIVNSFACFLASRANEQIYNNNTERSRVVYASHYGGMIPAGPGKSHQSMRDISLFSALPNTVIIQPCNATETEWALEYCVLHSTENCVLRLAIGPSPQIVPLPVEYRFEVGHGVSLTKGADALLFTYGPVMLNEALVAVEKCSREGFGLEVINMPWINRADPAWLRETVAEHNDIYVLEDHMLVGGLADRLLSSLVEHRLLGSRTFKPLGLDDHPKCGTPAEVLRFHGIDGDSLAQRIIAGSEKFDSPALRLAPTA